MKKNPHKNNKNAKKFSAEVHIKDLSTTTVASCYRGGSCRRDSAHVYKSGNIRFLFPAMIFTYSFSSGPGVKERERSRAVSQGSTLWAGARAINKTLLPIPHASTAIILFFFKCVYLIIFTFFFADQMTSFVILSPRVVSLFCQIKFRWRGIASRSARNGP